MTFPIALPDTFTQKIETPIIFVPKKPSLGFQYHTENRVVGISFQIPEYIEGILESLGSPSAHIFGKVRTNNSHSALKFSSPYVFELPAVRPQEGILATLGYTKNVIPGGLDLLQKRNITYNTPEKSKEAAIKSLSLKKLRTPFTLLLERGLSQEEIDLIQSLGKTEQLLAVINASFGFEHETVVTKVNFDKVLNEEGTDE